MLPAVIIYWFSKQNIQLIWWNKHILNLNSDFHPKHYIPVIHAGEDQILPIESHFLVDQLKTVKD